MGLSWMLVVVAEMLAVRSGLGSVLWNAYYVMRMDVIVAAMLSVGLLGFLFEQLVVAISNYVLRWNEGR
jgi:NitT/TauT family transport system permease protein